MGHSRVLLILAAVSAPAVMAQFSASSAWQATSTSPCGAATRVCTGFSSRQRAFASGHRG